MPQLGGGRFVAMTGARHFSYEKDGTLGFQLRKQYNGINAVIIHLRPDDTYAMTFWKHGRAPTFKQTQMLKHEGVYNNQLQTLFTEATGLVTRL